MLKQCDIHSMETKVWYKIDGMQAGHLWATAVIKNSLEQALTGSADKIRSRNPKVTQRHVLETSCCKHHLVAIIRCDCGSGIGVGVPRGSSGICVPSKILPGHRPTPHPHTHTHKPYNGAKGWKGEYLLSHGDIDEMSVVQPCRWDRGHLYSSPIKKLLRELHSNLTSLETAFLGNGNNTSGNGVPAHVALRQVILTQLAPVWVSFCNRRRKTPKNPNN